MTFTTLGSPRMGRGEGGCKDGGHVHGWSKCEECEAKSSERDKLHVVVDVRRGSNAKRKARARPWTRSRVDGTFMHAWASDGWCKEAPRTDVCDTKQRNSSPGLQGRCAWTPCGLSHAQELLYVSKHLQLGGVESHLVIQLQQPLFFFFHHLGHVHAISDGHSTS